MPVGHRIIVLGCPGSGKSTFAKALRDRTGLPLIHLDNIWWNPDRTHISRDEFDQRLDAVMSGSQWIIDGNYSRTYEARIRACDTVIFLDNDEKTCMQGIVERVGKDRTDIPWVEQELDPELVELVRRYRRDNRPVVLELLKKYPDKFAIRFETRSEAENWLLDL